MTIAELDPAVLARIAGIHYDRFLEKHEGPFDWSARFRHGKPEFIQVNSTIPGSEETYNVLLPIDAEQNANLNFRRVLPSADRSSLTLFLEDRTYATAGTNDMFCIGRIAICDRFPGQDFHIAIVYHEWFITD